ncbi:MAG: hypothetical protein KJO36_13205 [Acidimicrobiia bacterium]|nr:hypothetical protein [Acidimicrobiia bacterium]MBT8251172.1 hypothetical protein [Acidimicrobiia bacterium]NNC44189.1 hypothetical protein [Acidimicrobiia bacterium]NND12785.1 hypothetical protein [Acidimicrobiia bacterium]NNL29336.1 hypothetical protein [Acidimicrobiia bacterium]
MKGRSVEVSWGAVAIGIAIAIGTGSLLGIGINFTPLAGSRGAEVALLFLFFSMQMLAGYIAGRFSISSHGFNGAVAGLGTLAVPVLLSSIAQLSVPLLNVFGGAILALGFGYAGGLLTKGR